MFEAGKRGAARGPDSGTIERRDCMRVALLYPPPWKIPAPDEVADASDGPPADYRAGDLDADFYQTPYGLFALGAAALRAGHEVKIFNLSAFPWTRVEEVARTLTRDGAAVRWTKPRPARRHVPIRGIPRWRPDRRPEASRRPPILR